MSIQLDTINLQVATKNITMSLCNALEDNQYQLDYAVHQFILFLVLNPMYVEYALGLFKDHVKTYWNQEMDESFEKLYFELTAIRTYNPQLSDYEVILQYMTKYGTGTMYHMIELMNE